MNRPAWRTHADFAPSDRGSFYEAIISRIIANLTTGHRPPAKSTASRDDEACREKGQHCALAGESLGHPTDTRRFPRCSAPCRRRARKRRPHAAEVLPQTHTAFSRYFTVSARFTGLEPPMVRRTLCAGVHQRAKGLALKTFDELIQP
jgi:hypothetical protein